MKKLLIVKRQPQNLLIFACVLALFIFFLPETRASVDAPDFSSVAMARSYFESYPEKTKDEGLRAMVH